MAQSFKMLTILCLTISVSSKATFVKMEELFHPHLKQTIILGADIYSNDISQQDDVLAAIQNNKAYTILEVFNDDKPISEPTLLLHALEAELTLQRLPGYKCDFGKGLRQLIDAKYSFREYYTECMKKLGQDEDAKAAIFISTIRAFNQALADGFAILKEISQDIALLKNDNFYSADQIEILAIELDKIGILCNEINTIIATAFPKEVGDDETDTITFVDLVSSDTFIESINDLFHGESSLFSNLFDMSNLLFEMRVIVHILKNKREPVIFVCAYESRIDNISRILKDLSYIVQTSKERDLSNLPTSPNIYIGVDAISISPYFILAAIPEFNVQEFIAACKTLKNNPPADVAAAG
ncbi:MAG: hypothetical protein AB7F19_04475 [Candidatus Babeliales bacterium]